MTTPQDQRIINEALSRFLLREKYSARAKAAGDAVIIVGVGALPWVFSDPEASATLALVCLVFVAISIFNSWRATL